MRDPMTPERRVELEHDRARAMRLKAFLASDFWQEDLEPWFKEYRDKLGQSSIWRIGGNPDPVQIGIGCAYNGGRDQAVQDLLVQLNIWKVAGEEAARKLEPKETR